MTGLSGARVLLTGASSGLGQATALALAGRGARLVLTGRDPERLRRTAALTGGEVLPADLADPGGARALVADVLAGPLPDVVVHNAGSGLVASAGETTGTDVERLLRVNLAAPVEVTAGLLPPMLARGSGHLVFVTSVAAHLGVPREAAYAASKAGLDGYAASLRSELAGTGLRVTTFAPGVVDTPFFARRGAAYDRRVPRPLPAARCARALVAAVESDAAEVIRPRWLRVPVALRAAAPSLYARLERHLS